MRTIKTLLATAAGGLALAGCGAETSETQNTAISDEISHVVEAMKTVEDAVGEGDEWDFGFGEELAAEKAETAALEDRLAAEKAETAAEKAETAALTELADRVVKVADELADEK